MSFFLSLDESPVSALHRADSAVGLRDLKFDFLSVSKIVYFLFVSTDTLSLPPPLCFDYCVCVFLFLSSPSSSRKTNQPNRDPSLITISFK